MKRLLWVIVTALVLVAVVTGCDGLWRYDARLVAADSLMHDHPDSALALVQAIEPGSLTRERDRAYRELLLTQGRYRSYVPATSDSDINRALDYYRCHEGEREKLTRAYIYKGAVMEELGLPDTAMTYYKHAEATAAPNDYFNLGYINLRIGEMYQRFYINDSVALSKIKQATYYFTLSNDTSYLINTIGSIGAILYESNNDSSRFYLQKAISLAHSIHSSAYFKYQSKLAGTYFYNQNYVKAKDLAMDIILNGADKCDESMFYYYAARSFIKLSLLDSAHWVKSIIPSPALPIDSMNHFLLLAELAEADNNYSDYGFYIKKSKEISDSYFAKSANNKIGMQEIKIDAKIQNSQLKNQFFTDFTIAIAVTIAIIIFIISGFIKYIKNKIKVHQADIEHLRCELEQSIKNYENIINDQKKEYQEILNLKDGQLDQMNKEKEMIQVSTHHQVAAYARNRKAAMTELYQEIRVKATPGKNAKKRLIPLLGFISELNDQKKLLHINPKETFWKKLKLSIDCEYEGIATFVETNYTDLTEKEFHLFLLLCADISPQIIKLCMNYDHVVTVSNYKRKLVREKLGMDVKLEDFIQLYLDGQISK